MKLFNRGTDTPKPAQAAAPPAGPAAALATPAQPQAPAPAPAGAPAPAPAPPAAPPAPDLTAILDANVKDMSEKIAKLASTVESSTTEKGALEQKLELMEERMRKLSSLTEMISAQYSPFVGDAPRERDALPAPEVGLAAPPPPPGIAMMPAAAPAMPTPLPPTPISFAPAPAPALAAEPLATLVAPEPAPAPEFAPAPAASAPAPAPEPAWSAPEPSPVPVFAPAPSLAPVEENPDGVALWSVPPSFEASLLMLGWADMLTKHAGSRESLVSLVNYYHNIGWLGDPARDQLLAYADGISAPAPTSLAGDWRAAVETHEKSLLFVEKLRALAARRNG